MLELSQPGCARCVKPNEITAGTDVAAGGNLNLSSWLLMMLYFSSYKKNPTQTCYNSVNLQVDSEKESFQKFGREIVPWKKQI